MKLSGAWRARERARERVGLSKREGERENKRGGGVSYKRVREGRTGKAQRNN